MKDFVSQNFRKLIGKFYHFKDTLIFALEKGNPESDVIRTKYYSILLNFSLK